MSSAKAAEQYIAAGFAVVPVPAGEKNPGRRGWEQLRITKDQVPQYFTNGQNLGLHCGEPSGWRVPADLDCKEVRAVAGRFLPPTLTSGRESTPESHWWYRAPGAEHRTFTDLDNEMLLELRSTNHHTLVAPSKHPSGELYRWDVSGLEIAEVEAAELTEACQKLASAGLIARHLPELKDKLTNAGGGRHNFALALAGFLLRWGLSEDETLTLLKAAWDARGFAGDQVAKREAHRDLEGLVRDTARKIRDGEEATGGRKLEQLVPGLPRKLAEYWGWKGPPQDEGGFHLTDMGNAERLVHRFGADLRYCYPWGRWIVWDGTRWIPDTSGRVHAVAKETVRGIYKEAAKAGDDQSRKAISRHATASESETRVKSMAELAKPDLPVSLDDLDADPYLLNVPNGTLDLRSGELRPHARAGMITKLAPVEYDPDAAAPAWTAFLERILPDPEVRRFVQLAAGYSLTGDVSEQVLFIPYGVGANGKSTLLNILLEVLGDYAKQAAPDLLIAKKGAHPTELADLFGARMVASMEVEEGRRLAESLVKQLTGGDKIRARRMRQDFWEFWPTHKAWMATNHRPEIRGVDNAIWRRIRLIPFTEIIPKEEQDRRLMDKLRAELPGILAWAVRGCLDWQREGLEAPDQVRKATGEYRAEMDVLGGFLEECCELRQDYKELASEVYKAYQEWCSDSGEREVTRRQLTKKLEERGYPSKRSGPNGAREYHGLRLLTFWKSRICRETDTTDSKVTINGSKNAPRENIGKNASGASVRQSNVSDGPVSHNARPEDGAIPLVELKHRESIASELKRKGSGARINLAHYLRGDTTLEILTRSVLVGLGKDADGWHQHAPTVEAAAKDPQNHPLDCECGGCL
jgi:P4 family phage/plasmid primase-like protien